MMIAWLYQNFKTQFGWTSGPMAHLINGSFSHGQLSRNLPLQLLGQTVESVFNFLLTRREHPGFF